MATGYVYDTIKAKLVTDLGGSYAIRDFEEIEQVLQGEATPFLAVEEAGDDVTEVASIGEPSANWFNVDGAIDVHVFVPATGALTVARTIAEQIATSLRMQRFNQTAGESFRTTVVEAPQPGIIQDGLWHSMVVSVSYVQLYAAPTA